MGRRPLVVRVTYRRTDGRKARRNEPVLRIPALPGPADQDPAEILADDARLGRQAAAVFRGSRALAAKLGPDWQGWTGEIHGLSAFLHRGDRVFHTYSSYAPGHRHAQQHLPMARPDFPRSAGRLGAATRAQRRSADELASPPRQIRRVAATDRGHRVAGDRRHLAGARAEESAVLSRPARRTCS